jgi:hypothetical protein
MTRRRSFTKGEIMDAARAAAETGLSAKLCPTGEIVFTNRPQQDNLEAPTPEDVLEGWLRGRKARGPAYS